MKTMYRLTLERDDDPEDIVFLFETPEELEAVLVVARQYECGLSKDYTGSCEFDDPQHAIQFIKDVYEPNDTH